MRAVPGRLPVAKSYETGAVVYRGELVIHDGSCWQARRDTARAPGEGEDWACVAKSGRAGANGKSIVSRGVYDTRDSYGEGDPVAYEGQTFIATRSNPDGVPGDSDGWQLLAARGGEGGKGDDGAPGPRGEKGDQGATGAKIEDWGIDKERYRVWPRFSDGTFGPVLELRPLFELYLQQTSE